MRRKTTGALEGRVGEEEMPVTTSPLDTPTPAPQSPLQQRLRAAGHKLQSVIDLIQRTGRCEHDLTARLQAIQKELAELGE